MVERYLAKVDVASSKLVFRSTKTQLVCVLYIEKTAYINKQHGRLAQLVEQLTLNQWVRGSSPRSSTKPPRDFGYGAFVMIDSAIRYRILLFIFTLLLHRKIIKIFFDFLSKNC